jgi:hypothetical protein
MEDRTIDKLAVFIEATALKEMMDQIDYMVALLPTEVRYLVKSTVVDDIGSMFDSGAFNPNRWRQTLAVAQDVKLDNDFQKTYNQNTSSRFR